MLAGVLCSLAVLAWIGPTPRPASVAFIVRTDGPPRRPFVERLWVRALACSAGAATIGWVVVGPIAAVAGIVAGCAAAWWLGTLEPAAVAAEREAVARDLPSAAELLAACSLVGAPMDRALEVVVEALDGPLADRLRRVLVKLELGADPITVWRQLEADPVMATLARTLVRALESGAPPAEGLARLAADR